MWLLNNQISFSNQISPLAKQQKSEAYRNKHQRILINDWISLILLLTKQGQVMIAAILFAYFVTDVLQWHTSSELKADSSNLFSEWIVTQ